MASPTSLLVAVSIDMIQEEFILMAKHEDIESVQGDDAIVEGGELGPLVI